jgi:Integrase core domain
MLRDFVHHYNTERPHQSLGNRPLTEDSVVQAAAQKSIAGFRARDIRCVTRCNGAIRHYYRIAEGLCSVFRVVETEKSGEIAMMDYCVARIPNDAFLIPDPGIRFSASTYKSTSLLGVRTGVLLQP